MAWQHDRSRKSPRSSVKVSVLSEEKSLGCDCGEWAKAGIPPNHAGTIGWASPSLFGSRHLPLLICSDVTYRTPYIYSSYSSVIAALGDPNCYRHIYALHLYLTTH